MKSFRGACTVSIYEAQPLVARYFQHLLEECGFVIRGIASQLSDLDCIVEHKPSALLVAHHNPSDAIKVVDEIARKTRIPIVLCTEGLSASADDLKQKGVAATVPRTTGGIGQVVGALQRAVQIWADVPRGKPN